MLEWLLPSREDDALRTYELDAKRSSTEFRKPSWPAGAKANRKARTAARATDLMRAIITNKQRTTHLGVGKATAAPPTNNNNN